MMFRELRADEIEVRVADVREKGITLLLYKDARCDMDLLDETVGHMNWQRRHDPIDGVLYCSVGIRDEWGGWVWKQDAGTSGQFEPEKSQASDSFKRACTNWGIGRELYTAPRIWIPAQYCDIKQDGKGKWRCFDEFEVAKVEMQEHVIKCLAIRNVKTRDICFTYVEHGYVPISKRPKGKPDNIEF